jgi:hypothetical protein
MPLFRNPPTPSSPKSISYKIISKHLNGVVATPRFSKLFLKYFPERVFPILEFLAPLQVFSKDLDAKHRVSTFQGME